MEFKLLNSTIIFSASDINLNMLIKKYQQLSSNIESKFMDIYNSYGSFDNFVKYGLEDGLKLIEEYLEVIYKHLDSHIDISFEQYRSYYINDGFINEWFRLFEELEEIQFQFLNRAELEKFEREYRTANRTKLYGYGNNLSSTLKASAIAGSFNAISGVKHTFSNAIKKGIADARTDQQKRGLYKNQSLINEFRISINNAIFLSYYIEANLLKSLGYDIAQYKSQNFHEAEQIYNNLLNDSIVDKVHMRALAFRMIELNPTSLKYYQYAISQFEDPINEIQKTGDFFGLKLEDFKMNILINMVEEIKKETNVNKIKIKIEKLERKQKRLGFKETTIKCVEEAKEYYKSLKYADRTFEDIVYASIEEMEAGKLENEKLKQQYKSSKKDTREDINLLISKFSDPSNWQTNAPEKYIELLQKKLNQLDKADRTFRNIEYSSIEEKQMIEEEITFIEDLREHGDFLTSEGIKNLQKRMEFREIQTEEGKKFINFLNESLKAVEQEQLMVNGIKYNSLEEANQKRMDIKKEQEWLDAEIDSMNQIYIVVNNASKFSDNIGIKFPIIELSS